MYSLQVGVAFDFMVLPIDFMKNKLWILLLMLCGFMFSGCSPSQEVSPIVQEVPIEPIVEMGNTVTPFQPLALTSTVTPVPTATPFVCREEAGRIELHSLETEYIQEDFQFRVYVPPCYESRPISSYPVLFLFHGQTYTDDQWDRLGVQAVADELIISGQVVPFLVVMPKEEHEFQHPKESGFGNAVVDELIPWVDEHYRTCTERACRAVGGLSRGGAWAIRLGMTKWELFGMIGAHSTPPFEEYTYYFSGWWEVIPETDRPRIYLDVGNNDVYRVDTERFAAYLDQLGVNYGWHLFEGGHTEAYWRSHVKDYLQWYASGWKDYLDNQ